QKIIEKANKLISTKKYATAYKILNQYDPLNKSNDVFLKKYEIVSKFALSSKQHRSYALKDLSKNQDIKSLKINLNDLNYFDFKVDLIFDSLLKITPEDCELNKLASDHLFDIHIKFGKNWLKSEKEYLKQMAIYSEKTLKGKCVNDQSYYKIGYYLINVGKYKESIYFLNQSALKNDKNAMYHYNLSLSYLMTKAPGFALIHAKKAYSLYTDSLYKSDASRMLAEAYFQNNFVDSAIMFYEKAEELDSTTTNNIASLLNIYLKTSNSKANDLFIKFYKLDPTNPAIYNQLEQIYSNNALENELIKKYEDLLTTYSNDIEILANLKYYLARLYSIENTELAIETYLQSKSNFEKIYKSDHPVFNSIEQSIEQLKELKK
ncbi:MAG: tetratricopeptide repeat protein, partial [bacterium]